VYGEGFGNKRQPESLKSQSIYDWVVSIEKIISHGLFGMSGMVYVLTQGDLILYN